MALDLIDADHREVLRLVGPDGLTPGEAAAALGISPGAFQVRLMRARRAARAVLNGSAYAVRPFARPARDHPPEIPGGLTMPASGTRYDFDDTVLRELHAAQARLGSGGPARLAARTKPRLSGRVVLLTGAGAVTAVAAVTTAIATAGVTAIGSHSSGTAPRTGRAGTTSGPTTAAFLTARLSATLGGEKDYMITSKVVQSTTPGEA